MIRIDNTKVLKYIKANKELSKFFNYYIEHNASFDNPYHNVNHTFGMMRHIIEIFERSQNNEYDFVLSQTELYFLLVAALYHDIFHSKGLFTDEVNVYNAKLFLYDACKQILINENLQNNNSQAIFQETYDKCSQLIDATQFPYVIDDAKLTLLQRIIRECDLLVTLYDDFFTQVLMGLKSEMQGKDMESFLANEVKFLISSFKGLKLEYSIKIVNEHSKHIFEQIDILANINKC